VEIPFVVFLCTCKGEDLCIDISKASQVYRRSDVKRWDALDDPKSLSLQGQTSLQRYASPRRWHAVCMRQRRVSLAVGGST